MSEDLISKEKAYEVLTEYYHHRTEMQHKALRVALDMVPSANLQPTCNQLATNLQPIATDCISRQAAIDKFIDGLEEIFADIRERVVDDSVCGLCEYDGAYLGDSGNWCNECPGFEKDDCFKLSDKTRKEWTEEIIKALPSADIDLSDYSDRLWRNAYEQGKADAEPKWIPVTERLPENEQDVLVTVNDGCTHVEIDYFTGTHFLNYWDEVLAWMPLPECYRGAE